MTTETEEKPNHAIENGKGWMANIEEMMAKLEEAQEGEIECGQCEGTGEIIGGLGGDGDDEECPVCDGTGMIDSELDEDDVRQEINESPLSISVRGGWHSPGDPEGAKPDEYEILLSTGGPALRITGDLNDYSEPDGYPRLQWQDWFKPWTDCDITQEQVNTLQNFAAQFWFGE